jgi:recombination protein RecA
MEDIISKLVKRFDSENVIKFSDKDNFSSMKSWAHTGSPSLDYNLGTFGFPTGIVEIAGASRGGKTTLSLQAMANFQKENGDDAICVILSSENRDNKDYAQSIGVKTKNVLIVKVTFVEEMFMMVKQIVDEVNKQYKENNIKGKPKFFFMWDSLGATLSMNERETMEENTAMLDKKMSRGETIMELKHEKIGSFAKEAKKFAKYILSLCYSNIIHFIILNHVYDTIGGMGISVKKSTGGEWVSYLPTIRLQVSVRGMEKIDDVEVSQISKVKVVKNDFGSRTPTDIRILLGYGIILSQDDIDYAIENGILKKEGAKKVSFMNGKLTWSSPRELFNHYYNHNKFLTVLHNKIKKSMQDDLLSLKEKLNNSDEED